MAKEKYNLIHWNVIDIKSKYLSFQALQKSIEAIHVSSSLSSITLCQSICLSHDLAVDVDGLESFSLLLLLNAVFSIDAGFTSKYWESKFESCLWEIKNEWLSEVLQISIESEWNYWRRSFTMHRIR